MRRIKEAIYSASRSEWHAWLERHHRDKTEAWLLLYKKGIDQEKYAQRFAPRRKGSSWTASNVAIAERMIQDGKMQSQGLEAYRTRKNSGS